MAETDLISRQAAIDAIENTDWYHQNDNGDTVSGANPDMHQAWYKEEDVYSALESVPSAQPEQRYTEEELRVFAHGISLSLLSKRSAQHWRYDKDTATEIEFLERLYDKVSADMKGGQG